MPQRLPPSESLTVEFKSDRSKLPDADLIEALVCLPMPKAAAHE